MCIFFKIKIMCNDFMPFQLNNDCINILLIFIVFLDDEP